MKPLGRAGGPLVFVLLALAGCGNASSMPSGESPSIAAQVPDAVKTKGTLTVATDPTYPPNEFLSREDHTLTGMDPELMRAAGALMGLKVKFVYEPFNKILASVAAGDYDVGASSFTDTKKREQTVDFVDYYAAGTSLYSSAYRLHRCRKPRWALWPRRGGQLGARRSRKTRRHRAAMHKGG